MKQHPVMYKRTVVYLVLWCALAAGCFVADTHFPLSLSANGLELISETSDTAGPRLLRVCGVIFSLLAGAALCRLSTAWYFGLKRRPAAEATMVGRIYGLIAALAILLCVVYGAGKFSDFSKFFAMFGGMLLGFSLQAPVSGFAAFVMISLKRPFRPGDRVQFPNLGITGDVQDIGVMYTVLDQVGGTIGSEEAVGRYILVPNAMLFSQVAINYTVTQDTPYMLDEVVVRITFDSNWDAAEKLMLHAAEEITKDIIITTGVRPYIRSDMYDYGVYLRLRYQTSVKDRAEIAYKISKMIFEKIKNTPEVDLAIPFIYSARAGQKVMNAPERQEDPVLQDRETREIRDVELAHINSTGLLSDIDVVEQLAQSIATHGLLQPIVLIPDPEGKYDVVAGQLRLEACKRLGWQKIPAVVRGSGRLDRLSGVGLNGESTGAR